MSARVQGVNIPIAYPADRRSAYPELRDGKNSRRSKVNGVIRAIASEAPAISGYRTTTRSCGTTKLGTEKPMEPSPSPSGPS